MCPYLGFNNISKAITVIFMRIQKALKLPTPDKRRNPKNPRTLFGCCISYLWTYDLYGPIRNAFDAGKSITRASGRGLGPGNRDFSGPCEMASSY